MKTARLTRNVSTDAGTFGQLVVWKLSFCSGELPWRGNKPDISCIPVGQYICKWEFSPHLKRKAYQLQNVWGRSEIMIHPANTMGDTTKKYFSELNGCIALGRMVGQINGQKGLLKSKDAVIHFEEYMNQEDFLLIIEDSPTLAVD